MDGVEGNSNSDELDDECQLAYGLHLVPGFKCRRRGGNSQCGACAGDLLPQYSPIVTMIADRLLAKLRRKFGVE